MSRPSYLREIIDDFFLDRKVAKVQKVVDKNQYPPTFNPKKWEKKRGYNCYAYALDVPVKDVFNKFWLPGVLSGISHSGKFFSVPTLVEHIKADIKTLGFSCREDDGILHKGEYKIAIYHIPSYYDIPIQFHMVRQDEDGRWSEKPSRNSEVMRFKGKSATPPDLSKYDAYLCEILIIKKK